MGNTTTTDELGTKKIMVAFLGTATYQPCFYKFEGDLGPSEKVSFVQTVVRQHLPDDVTCIIFCTQEAQEKNGEKLAQEFREHGLTVDFVRIPFGKTTEELWRIFDLVQQNIPTAADVYFDVTHSFRSHSVITTELVNYLVTVKKCRLAGWYYGAFETRDLETNVSPIFDLTPFFELNEWTSAIAEFRDDSSARHLAELVRRKLNPFLDKDASLRPFNQVFKVLEEFGACIRLGNLKGACRLTLRKTVQENLKEDSNAKGLLAALKPILGQLKNDFLRFKEVQDEVHNGFEAAAWAAEHNLLPQAYTMLREVVVTAGVQRKWYDENFCKADGAGAAADNVEVRRREYVSDLIQACGIEGVNWGEWRHGDFVRAQELAKRIPKDLVSLFLQIKSVRNALNHGGTNPKEPVDWKKEKYTPEGFRRSLDEIRRIFDKLDAPMD